MIKEFKPVYPRYEELKTLLLKVIDEQSLVSMQMHPDGQLAVQTDGSDDWHCGVGSSKGKDWQWERSFNVIHPALKGTVVEDYLNWLEVPVYRTRIMLAREKGCYSIHKDMSPRLHLPLVTNPQCFFLFAEPGNTSLHHMPADGRTSWVDTRMMHSFLNGSTELRFHLVMIVDE